MHDIVLTQPIILDQFAPGIIIYRHILQRRISRSLQKVEHAGGPVNGMSKYDKRTSSIVRVEQGRHKVYVGGNEGVGEVGWDEAEVKGAGNALGGGNVYVCVVVLAEGYNTKLLDGRMYQGKTTKTHE